MTAISAPAITLGVRARWGGSRISSGGVPTCCWFLMLVPPLLWLGIIYVGSLLALLLQSFFSIDEFSGLINYEFTLQPMANCCSRRISISSCARS